MTYDFLIGVALGIVFGALIVVIIFGSLFEQVD